MIVVKGRLALSQDPILETLREQLEMLVGKVGSISDLSSEEDYIAVIAAFATLYSRMYCPSEGEKLTSSPNFLTVLCQFLESPLAKSNLIVSTGVLDTIGRICEALEEARVVVTNAGLLKTLMSFYCIQEAEGTQNLFDLSDKIIYLCSRSPNDTSTLAVLNANHLEATDIVGLISNDNTDLQFRGARLCAMLSENEENSKALGVATATAISPLLNTGNTELCYYASASLANLAHFSAEACEVPASVDSLVKLLTIPYEVVQHNPRTFPWFNTDPTLMKGPDKSEWIVNVGATAARALYELSCGMARWNSADDPQVDAKGKKKANLLGEAVYRAVLNHGLEFLSLIDQIKDYSSVNTEMYKELFRILVVLLKYPGTHQTLLDQATTAIQARENPQEEQKSESTSDSWPMELKDCRLTAFQELVRPVINVLRHPEAPLDHLQVAYDTLESLSQCPEVETEEKQPHSIAECFENTIVANGGLAILLFLSTLDLPDLTSRLEQFVRTCTGLGSRKTAQITEAMLAEEAEDENEEAETARNPEEVNAATLDRKQRWGALLDIKTDFTRLGFVGYNALHVCLTIGNPDLVEILLEEGANPNICNSNGVSALPVALSINACPKIIPLLLSHGADVDAMDPKEDNVLKYAFVSSQQPDVFELSRTCSLTDEIPGSPDFVMDLLLHSVDPNVSDADGNFPLHLAVSKAVVHTTIAECPVTFRYQSDMHTSETVVNVVEGLLHHGADINVCNKIGQTPLHLAILHGHIAAVDKLMEAGAMTNIRDVHGALPLHYACLGQCEGSEDLVSRLLKVGTRFPIVDGQHLDDRKGKNAQEKKLLTVDKILRDGFKNLINPDIISTIRASEKELVSLKTHAGFLPIHYACGGDQVVEFEGMSQRVENVARERLGILKRLEPIQDLRKNMTCLHLAAKTDVDGCNSQVIEYLLKVGTDLNRVHDAMEISSMKGEYSLSALHYALLANDKVSQQLLDAKATLTPKGSDIPLLALACYAGRSVSILKQLINDHANIRLKLGDMDGTALHFAVGRNDRAAVELLVQYPDLISTEVRQQSDGLTPVQLAVALNYSEITMILLKNGAKMSDVLEEMVKREQFELIQRLVDLSLISEQDLEDIKCLSTEFKSNEITGSENIPLQLLEQSEQPQ